jgi:hypothetical protein
MKIKLTKYGFEKKNTINKHTGNRIVSKNKCCLNVKILSKIYAYFQTKNQTILDQAIIAQINTIGYHKSCR